MYTFKKIVLQCSYILATLCVGTLSIKAQQNDFSFSGLGSAMYKDRIAELQKFKAPKKYADKSGQAWYEEIVTERNKTLLASFKEDEILYDTSLLAKCNSILKKIAASNKQYNFESIRLYINRSMVANAACYGEGTVMVNLGLFLWIDNEDELALVLGHELAHQLLNHSDGKMEKSIAMLTSDDFKSELKDIKKADYGKYDRFRKLMKGLYVEAGKHSTYKESEADSLGFIFIKNAGYNVNSAANILLKLDKVDELFSSNKLYSAKSFFEKTPADLSHFIIKPTYKGLSSVKVTMNADKDMDSVKTHPDCTKRYEAIVGQQARETPDCCVQLNEKNKALKERAMLEIVRNLYENNSIGLCTHLCIFALQNNYNPVIYNRFLSLCFSKLYYQDKQLERFNTANAYAKSETTLKELQDFLFAVSTKDLEKLSLHFLTDKIDTASEDYEFANLMYKTQVKQTEPAVAYAGYNKKFPNNKYQYLLQKK